MRQTSKAVGMSVLNPLVTSAVTPPTKVALASVTRLAGPSVRVRPSRSRAFATTMLTTAPNAQSDQPARRAHVDEAGKDSQQHQLRGKSDQHPRSKQWHLSSLLSAYTRRYCATIENRSRSIPWR